MATITIVSLDDKNQTIKCILTHLVLALTVSYIIKCDLEKVCQDGAVREKYRNLQKSCDIFCASSHRFQKILRFEIVDLEKVGKGYESVHFRNGAICWQILKNM